MADYTDFLQDVSFCSLFKLYILICNSILVILQVFLALSFGFLSPQSQILFYFVVRSILEWLAVFCSTQMKFLERDYL